MKNLLLTMLFILCMSEAQAVDYEPVWTCKKLGKKMGEIVTMVTIMSEKKVVNVNEVKVLRKAIKRLIFKAREMRLNKIYC